jgi:MarR family transcriptional regulator, organic hydroperoxide resistance regulator
MALPEPHIPRTAGAGPMSYAIFQLARAHRAHAATLLRAMDLHPGQELVLMHLFDRDGQSQSELLEGIGVDHSTISKALRRMQDAGLVVREPAAHDRRVMVVHLTEKGRAMREPIAALWQALEETSARTLSPRQAESFVETAYAITEAISNRPLPEGQPG